jgi:hypothetical protein
MVPTQIGRHIKFMLSVSYYITPKKFSLLVANHLKNSRVKLTLGGYGPCYKDVLGYGEKVPHITDLGIS